jgi:hypothetical protein
MLGSTAYDAVQWPSTSLLLPSLLLLLLLLH